MLSVLIIPAWNEAPRISPVIDTALKAATVEEVIVVDDGSNDGTYDLALESGVTVLQHRTNLGKGEAMQTGYEHAKGLGATTLLFLDADLHNLTTYHIESLVTK